MDNNIKNFTSADIEKYHKGQLTSREMHDLEKAAMDDPFLADALEGYAVAGVNAGADMAALKKRLAVKVDGAKVIPLNSAPRNSFRMLRVAAVIVFLASAGLLIYQFGFNKNPGEKIAQRDKTNTKEEIASDTVRPTTQPSTPASTLVTESTSTATKAGPATDKTVTSSLEKEEKSGGKTEKIVSGETNGVIGNTRAEDVVVIKPPVTQPVATPPVKTMDERAEQLKLADKSAEKKELARREINNKAKNKTQEPDKDNFKDQETDQINRAVAGSRADNNQYYNNSNTFRGRVTDAGNIGVPFANVTNVQDNNAGTYTDAKGYFNLTYPDSVLNVQVRSLGFENTNVQLRNTVPTNQVIMQDDRKSLSEVVLSKQKPNATARNRDGTMKLEEPEPADGWDNYDTYLVNNLNIPEDFKSKPTTSGAVEVSFEVDKNGGPTSIKVEKSLCTQCDKEAIRLIKEGPKWKRKAKKGRTTVTIYF
ncbi:MAG: carboxypeptidase-like regulatory domain-containing protein [Ferruginibacter sp.]|nr:carboxypeptidase-like regulatory domain-containing protein [Chitinophagaceae bacterium]